MESALGFFLALVVIAGVVIYVKKSREKKAASAPSETTPRAHGTGPRKETNVEK